MKALHQHSLDWNSCISFCSLCPKPAQFLPASVLLPSRPTWKQQSWRHPRRWHLGFGLWWPPVCLWRRVRTRTQVSAAHWGPSSSSSFEVLAWASSFLLRVASRRLSKDRKSDGGEMKELQVINPSNKCSFFAEAIEEESTDNLFHHDKLDACFCRITLPYAYTLTQL